ncbi:hypothetical protein MARCHEWKA_01280 [Brevundimonas phage vB_BpoS-Marchewka]|uniref:Uncharacterized protein n=1 Tax=Brevundimonas phage vB_BpoS-Marchewka TaxID=2948604 RepID=A0A9E7SSD6_9CAUD|nr:hypothetical protein MARCHEWKA_01280 [Brevundimonas phage vB_BpoS-Marchewka]
MTDAPKTPRARKPAAAKAPKPRARKTKAAAVVALDPFRRALLGGVSTAALFPAA